MSITFEHEIESVLDFSQHGESILSLESAVVISNLSITTNNEELLSSENELEEGSNYSEETSEISLPRQPADTVVQFLSGVRRWYSDYSLSSLRSSTKEDLEIGASLTSVLDDSLATIKSRDDHVNRRTSKQLCLANLLSILFILWSLAIIVQQILPPQTSVSKSFSDADSDVKNGALLLHEINNTFPQLSSDSNQLQNFKSSQNKEQEAPPYSKSYLTPYNYIDSFSLRSHNNPTHDYML